jgi:hypothetical protein
MKKIYESPDKGKTIYERNFGDYEHRKLIIKASLVPGSEGMNNPGTPTISTKEKTHVYLQ